MKIGDHVRFLDAVGGGIVKSFGAKDTVIVEDQDGFDIPVSIRNCVIVDDGEDHRMASSSSNDKNTSSTATSAKDTPRELEPADKPITYQPTITQRKGGDKINLFLCFKPLRPQQLSNSNFDIYFVNDSNYQTTFNLICGQGATCFQRHAATAEPNTKILLENISTESLNELQHICMQMIFSKPQHAFTLKAPISIEMRLDLTRFYKWHLFCANDFFTTPVLTFPLVEDDVAKHSDNPNSSIAPSTILERKGTDKRSNNTNTTKPLKLKNAQDEVVDLHASELFDTTSGMTPSDILECQLDVFRKKMDEASKKKGRRIVFIHGKGEGVLRSKIISILRNKYSHCVWQDASFREYGFGATLVIIR